MGKLVKKGELLEKIFVSKQNLQEKQAENDQTFNYFKEKILNAFFVTVEKIFLVHRQIKF